MRLLLLCCLIIAIAAGEAMPPTTQKLLDDSAAATSKARQAYDAAVKKEQDKLIAALQKEQEKETKKGNLDGALAVKKLISDVEAGLLQKQADAPGDLLGDSNPAAVAQPIPAAAASGAAPPAAMPADLLTDCRTPTGNYPTGSPPEALDEFMRRSVVLRLPAGDKTRYQFSAQLAGSVVIVTGDAPHHAELWSELERSGFRQVPGGAEQRWYLANLRLNERFAVFNVEGGVPTLVLAARIKPAR